MRRLAVALACVCGCVGLDVGAVTARIAIAPVIYREASSSGHRIALTFDDGPSLYTPQILAVLHRFRAHASFFVVGTQVAEYPGFARAEASAGDAVGNHTYSHADLQWLDDQEVADQLSRNQHLVWLTTGRAPQWFRPPYGAVDERVAAIAASLGLRTVTWSVDPQDWALPGVPLIVWRVESAVRPGSVILMHDGGGNRSQTVAALAEILPVLRARGYKFVTLDTLFGVHQARSWRRHRAHHSRNRPDRRAPNIGKEPTLAAMWAPVTYAEHPKTAEPRRRRHLPAATLTVS